MSDIIFLGYNEKRNHKWYILNNMLVYAFYIDGDMLWIRQPLKEIINFD